MKGVNLRQIHTISGLHQPRFSLFQAVDCIKVWRIYAIVQTGHILAILLHELFLICNLLSFEKNTAWKNKTVN